MLYCKLLYHCTHYFYSILKSKGKFFKQYCSSYVINIENFTDYQTSKKDLPAELSNQANYP